MRAAIFAGLLLAVSTPAAAEWKADRPLRVQKVTGPEGEVTCTVYSDYMLREVGTDTPSPQSLQMIRYQGAAPACSAKTPAGARALDAGGSFDGRAGGFLFFQDADSNGATLFTVLDVKTNRTVVVDGTMAEFTSVKTGPDLIEMDYERAINAECSILQDGAACWRRTAAVKQNDMAPGVMALGPPVEACRRSYRADNVPHDDPSIITYRVHTVWTRTGGRRTTASAPVGCLPMP